MRVPRTQGLPQPARPAWKSGRAAGIKLKAAENNNWPLPVTEDSENSLFSNVNSGQLLSNKTFLLLILALKTEGSLSTSNSSVRKRSAPIPLSMLLLYTSETHPPGRGTEAPGEERERKCRGEPAVEWLCLLTATVLMHPGHHQADKDEFPFDERPKAERSADSPQIRIQLCQWLGQPAKPMSPWGWLGQDCAPHAPEDRQATEQARPALLVSSSSSELPVPSSPLEVRVGWGR